MTNDMRELKQMVDGLLTIPANEQCIGHLQVAVQKMFKLAIEEIEKLQKVVGIYRAG